MNLIEHKLFYGIFDETCLTLKIEIKSLKTFWKGFVNMKILITATQQNINYNFNKSVTPGYNINSIKVSGKVIKRWDLAKRLYYKSQLEMAKYFFEKKLAIIDERLVDFLAQHSKSINPTSTNTL